MTAQRPPTAAESGDPGDRLPTSGLVDFTIMYAAHDAFSRDLRRMVAACEQGHGFASQTAAGWAAFVEQLHIHHNAEDVVLWPRLRAAVTEPREQAVLDAMEAEHAGIEPQLHRVRMALQNRDEAALADSVAALSAELVVHMRHEEVEALPLIEKHLGPAGWRAFASHMRKTQGLRGGAAFFPWLLDGAPEPTIKRVLDILPRPVRVLYRRRWAPRYRRQQLWTVDERPPAPYRTRPALPPRR